MKQELMERIVRESERIKNEL